MKFDLSCQQAAFLYNEGQYSEKHMHLPVVKYYQHNCRKGVALRVENLIIEPYKPERDKTANRAMLCGNGHAHSALQ